MDIKKILGKRIKEVRKTKNLTQERMAELIGIETPSLSNIERGKYFPSAENFNKIIEALNIGPDELFDAKHLQPQNILIQEMCDELTNNEKLTKIMYQIFKSIKIYF